MLSESRYKTIGSRLSSVLAILVLVFFAGPGCDDDEPGGPQGPFSLTFRGDATFQGPHGGQTITVAVVRASDGTVLARQNGTVSATADPAFSFVFAGLLQAGTDYELHYWIDSNFGGGTAGVCDPRAIDHQWSVEFLSVSNDITAATAHQPALTEDVCSSFP